MNSRKVGITALSDDLPLLLRSPLPPAFAARDDFDTRVPSAPTIGRTSALIGGEGVGRRVHARVASQRSVAPPCVVATPLTEHVVHVLAGVQTCCADVTFLGFLRLFDVSETPCL